MITESSNRLSHRGTLPKFRELMHGCREKVSKHFASLFKSMLDDADEILITLADSAGSDTSRTTFFEAIQEIQLRRLTIEQDFYQAIAEGFQKFDRGKMDTSKKDQSSRKLGQLSLVDKDDFEVTVAITNTVTSAQNNFSEHLYALNHRLAVINGGTKLGERSAALPAGPKHLCEAFLISIDSITLPLEVKIPLLRSFQRYVVDRAGAIYDEFNSSLLRAGVLPNLTLGIPDGSGVSGRTESGYTQHNRYDTEFDASGTSVPPPTTARRAGAPHGPEQYATGQPGVGSVDRQYTTQLPEAAQSDEQYAAQLTGYHRGNREEEELKQALFQGISQILSQRSHGSATVAGPRRPGQVGTVIQDGITTTNLRELVPELNRLQHSSVPHVSAEERNINATKDAFFQQIEKLGEILTKQNQQVATADADAIDLVGMLFEMILDDGTLPDAVKALLSHLHTPFLKIAVLDKRVFFKGSHPARRLLNALSQAGSLCSGADGSSLSIISKIRDIVKRIVTDFEDDTEIFSPLLDEFTAFMSSHHRRSILTEKRAVEAAKGREKLQSARRRVSHEIVNRLVKRKVPKIVESLLMGPWANYLVITFLRSGEHSQQWLSSLEATDNLIWSVQRKNTDEERSRLRLKLPAIVDTIKAGLEISGDIESNIGTILNALESCHKAALAAPKRSEPVPAVEKQEQPEPLNLEVPTETPITVVETEQRVKKLQDIIPEEWRQALSEETDSSPSNGNVTLEHQALIDSLKELEFGTWFEFFDEEKEVYQRGKLAWINTTTSNYMFVNQGGRQIAVKSLHNLAEDLHQGRAKIIDIERTPFVDRALKSIQELLRKESA